LMHRVPISLATAVWSDAVAVLRVGAAPRSLECNSALQRLIKFRLRTADDCVTDM
jgi:hypothetical protein